MRNVLTSKLPKKKEEEEGRIFVKEVAGYGDLDSLFTEWTDSQKEEWESAHSVEEMD